jgi:cell division protein FtsA
MKAKAPNFVALDIGSSKIAAIVTNIDKKGEVNISCQTMQYSAGFKSSVIIDFAEAEETILRTIYSLEKECEKSIREVSVALSGSNTKSYYINCHTQLNNQPITKSDTKKLLEKALSEFKTKGQEIISYFPIEFGIDENNFIKNPIGMIGKELRCQLHIIAANSNLILNLTNCLAKCQIQISNLTLAVHASGIACLSEDEQNLGSIIIDMGGGTTSFGIFWLGKFIYSGSVNLGGNHITLDIAKVFSLSVRSAEKLKILYGNASASTFEKNKMISLEEIDDDIDNLNPGILMGKLSAVIGARLEEILLKVKEQYDLLGVDHLIGRRLVVTGGGSSLRGLKEFMSKIFDKQIRIAKPPLLPGFQEDHNPAAYATIIGMAINYSARQQKDHIENENDENANNWMSATIRWVKENI